MGRVNLSRRGFLGAAGAVTLALPGAVADDDPRPVVTQPRATDGDDVHEPAWDERLTLTVAPEGKSADMIGRDDKVIQAALAYVARLGGGTVRLSPGTFTLRNAVVLPSRVRLIGSGAETIITKIPSRSVTLADDSDWYDREITLENARGFNVGDGVVLPRAPIRTVAARSCSSALSSRDRGTASGSRLACVRTSGSPASQPARPCFHS